MSTQVVLFTNVEPDSVSHAIEKHNISRSIFYQGDCLVEMDKIANKSIDMILCDLPYGTTACKWDSVIPFEPLWKHYERIIKDNGAIALTASQPFTTDLINSNRRLFRYELIWQKSRPSNVMLCKKQPLKYHENILIFYKKQPTYNPEMRLGNKSHATKESTGFRNILNSKTINKINISEVKYPSSVLSFASTNNVQNINPTQKPILLFEYLIKTYTNEGETVLDNCMGSGTTGVAAKNTGRLFIGIEKDETQFEMAVNRITNY